MNTPTALDKFPVVSVLAGLSAVNGRIIDNPAVNRGARGADGVTTPVKTVDYIYETTSPTLMSVNIETVEL